MKKIIFVALFFWGLVSISSISHSQTFLPNDIDLRSAYCTGVLKEKIAALKRQSHLRDIEAIKTIQDELNQRFQRDLRRLNLYLLPRISHIENQGLLSASVSGAEDFVTGSEDMINCAKIKNCATNDTCFSECRTSSPSILRTDRCNNTNFLPQ